MQKKKLISFLSFAYLFKQKKKSYVFDVKKVIEVYRSSSGSSGTNRSADVSNMCVGWGTFMN